jgi:putative ABC transport system permease protein
MASAAAGAGTGAVRLVELRAVGPEFPYYGAVELVGGAPISPELLADNGVLAPQEFLLELGLAPGDVVRLAGRPFTVRGVVARDRVQSGGGGFVLGPRLYVSLESLEGMRILGFGSTASYQVYLRVAEAEVGGLVRRLRSEFSRQSTRVRSWRAFEDRLGRNLTTAENYLSLVGFAMVVLGGLGVWSVTRVLVQQKVKSVAILKCLGASSRQVLATYVTQVSWLAAAGSGLGVLLAAGALALVPSSALEPLGIEQARVTASAAAQGIAVGLLVSLLFALVPLLEMRRIKPFLLLRADTAASARRPDRVSLGVGAATVAALVVVGVWQAGSLAAVLFVSAGLLVVGLVLAAASRLLIRGARSLARSRRFAVRHAALGLGRPGNQTRVILMAVGLGCFFVLSIRALQANLLQEFDAQIGTSSPDLVLVDVQADQVDAIREAVSPYVLDEARVMPLMRGRVVAIIGRRVDLPTPEDVRQQGGLTREFGLTYRESLQTNETMTAGEFWTGPLEAPPETGVDTEVSISEEVREEVDVGIGDLVRLDVAGQVVTARVTSVRRVAWDDTQSGGFFFVLRPAPVMARLPSAFVGFLRVGEVPESRAAVQRVIVDRFPNVSAIDVRAIVGSIREMIDNITLGITIVGVVTVVSGMLILVGAVAMTRFQRLYEAAIYRTLGATTRLLTAMVAVEYGLLGLLAGVLGAAGALALSWALARFLFEIDWRPAPGLLATGALLTGAVVCVVGLVASFDVLARKPLASLRGE